MKWFVHHLKTKEKNVPNTKCLTSTAKSLLEWVENEIRNLVFCPECYERAYSDPVNFFVKPCRQPHILVWAIRDERYWPAKLLSYSDSGDENVVYVRFFGDHCYSCVKSSHESSDVYVYSIVAPQLQLPTNRTAPATNESYNMAMKVS